MRTDEQRQAFALECLEIEKRGGDVLAYIRDNWPSYSPRATWYNLQIQFLGRRIGNLTEGKSKGGENMSKMLEVAKQTVEAAGTGTSVFAFLAEQGYKNPSSTWYMLKQQAKKHDPDLYEQMAAIPTGFKKDGKKPKKKAETVSFNGKDYEKYEAPETVVEVKGKMGNTEHIKLYGASPTCCQPAKPSGVTVPDELPGDKTEHMSAKEYSGVLKMEAKKPEGEPYRAHITDEIAEGDTLPVCAVKSRIKGEWHLSTVEGCVHLIWEDKITHEERSLGLPAADWQKLAKEIPVMLMQLGLAN